MLSVALCTYNGEKYLPYQLDSLLLQTRLPDEVVVGDDASTDGTWEILQAFASRAAGLGVSVRLERNARNLGYVRNFSETLRRASGDLLFLCDQDDIWRPSKLALMESRFLENPDLLLLCGDANLVDGQGQSLGSTLFEVLGLKPSERAAIHDGGAFGVLMRRSMVTGATAAIRRSLLEFGLPVGEGWVHDEWLAIMAAALGSLEVLEVELIDYRQHGGNQIGMRRRTIGEKWRDLARSRALVFQAEVKRLDLLQRHFRSLGERIPLACMEQLERRRMHFVRRIAIGRIPRWQRLGAIITESRSGNYERYGTGGRSMLRDLIRHD